MDQDDEFSNSFTENSAHSSSSTSLEDKKKTQRRKIELLIRSNDDRIELIKKPQAKSTIWSSIRLVKLGSDIQDCVYCMQCKNVLQGLSQGSGHLNKHLKACKGAAKFDTPKIKSMLGGKKIPQTVKDKVAKDQVSYLARDLRPLSSCDKSGFLKIAQSLINVGALLGSVKAEDVLTKRKALTKRVMPELYSDMQEKLREIFLDLLETKLVAFTTDHWTSSVGESFIAVTIHGITNSFELKSHVVGMRTQNVAHTGEKTKQKRKTKHHF